MTHSTQSQEQGRRRQRRSGQTHTLTPRATTRATRLAVLALAVVVATAVLGGFGGPPAEAAYIWWQGYVPNYYWIDWYNYCIQYHGMPYSGEFPGSYYDGSLCLAGIECPLVFIGCELY